LKWRLTSLNRSLGPLRKGDFGFIFARPETGKTTFLASEVTFMASQAESSVLWINNEEQGEKVLLRCYEAALGAPLEQIIANRERAKAAFFERTGRRIRLLDNAGVTRRDVERLCEIHNPSLIIVDQLDKVKGFDGDREDLRMGAIYQWARELAKQYAPVIGVSQSDGSGEGVKYLNMGNVANAKTAKQAEADWILGIGFSYDDHPNVRGISICKNKLIGGEESVSKMRHGKFDVLIEPEIARYRDMQKD
jgi:replicative DNA helicase